MLLHEHLIICKSCRFLRKLWLVSLPFRSWLQSCFSNTRSLRDPVIFLIVASCSPTLLGPSPRGMGSLPTDPCFPTNSISFPLGPGFSDCGRRTSSSKLSRRSLETQSPGLRSTPTRPTAREQGTQVNCVQTAWEVLWELWELWASPAGEEWVAEWNTGHTGTHVPAILSLNHIFLKTPFLVLCPGSFVLCPFILALPLALFVCFYQGY